MKVIGITSTAILSLLLGVAGPAYAQHEQQGEKQDHPQQQQSQHEQAKPEQQHAQQQRQPAQKQQQTQHVQQQQRQDQNKQTQQRAQQQQRQDLNKQTQQRAQQQQRQDKNKQTQQRAAQQQSQRPERTQQQRVEQSAWQQHRSQNWDSDHRSWQQRGGYHGYRIPDDRYRGYFGQDHGFRIYGLPFLVVGGYPRFQYEGYWLSMIDPWPEYWGNDWYDNDDVYVMYVDNGYYLFNRRYPNVGLAINISM